MKKLLILIAAKSYLMISVMKIERLYPGMMK